MRKGLLATIVIVFLSLDAGPAVSQGAQVPFGGLKHDAGQPVEITADALALDQASGAAVFTGGVKVGQGTLRLAADRIEVFYASDDTTTGEVTRMLASGNVTLSNGTEAAEAQEAAYDVSSGLIEMTGDVLLTQNANALSSETLRIDLNTGTGTMEGRVQTILVPGSKP